MAYEMRFDLISDATFGRGEGVAGLVDVEVEHDRHGLPFLGGRALKGLLVEECANLLYGLSGHPAEPDFRRAAHWLFGRPGSAIEDEAHLHVGRAQLPADLRAAVQAEVEQALLSPADVLESFTAIRRQTAVGAVTGAPEAGSLRSLRVVLRQTPFVARLDLDGDPDADSLALLAACVRCVRRAGTGRNRGRGRLAARLHDDQGRDVTDDPHLAHLAARLRNGPPKPGSAR